MVQENTAGETNAVQTHAIDKDETMWAMFCHLATFAGLVVPFIGNIVGPLLIWLLKRDEYPLVENQGKEALNFQISITIYFVVSIILIFVVIGIFILPALFIFDVIVTIVAMVKASEGVEYRYPMSLRLIN